MTGVDDEGRARAVEQGELRLGRSELLMIVAFWTFMAILNATNRMLNPRGPGLAPGASLAIVGLTAVESYIWALLTPPLFALSARAVGEHQPRARRVLTLLALGIVVAVGVGFVEEAMRAFVISVPPRPDDRGFLARSLNGFRLLNDLIIYIAVVAVGAARASSIRFRARREEAAQLHAQLAQARLEALRMQLNPHFLFNTLNAISSLVERDPRGVRRMIARLSDLLRHTIDGPVAQEIPLRDELELLRRYLEIMEVRFQGRLAVEMQIDDAVLDALVPNLILQPIVENAIEHGISNIEGEGRIDVRAARAGHELVLRVWNNGPPPVATASADGIGLSNTRARLAQLYDGDGRFTLAPADAGVAAELRLPFHTRADVRAAV